MRDHVLIANGQGFWGDSILGPVRLVREGPLHYLALDYLAEVTMSIMQKLKSRNPAAGYATVYPCLSSALPTASNLNFAAAESTANGGVMQHGRGYGCVWTSVAAEVVVDVFGVWS